MSNLNTLIQQSVNPFDTTHFKRGNFWEEEQSEALSVNSIHQEVLETIKQTLEAVAEDKKSRTLILEGDSGSGKTYLLGRVKKKLSQKAFFAHIIASIQADYTFQYTLRKTIESLMFIPEEKSNSQLLLWLKDILYNQSQGLVKQLLGERKLFVNNMKLAYPNGIWQPNSFFNVLYSLTRSHLYPLACDWLKGDDLEAEDLKKIGAKVTIQSEQDAMDLLSNLSRISQASLPIVLCFDEIDISNNRQDLLESILRLNMIIHSQKLKNFLVILSVITDTWNKYQGSIEASLKAPINQAISLKPITTEQVEALWSVHLNPLHQKAKPQPNSKIAPLTKNDLENYFPSGKANPRSALKAGHQLIQHYKTGQIVPPDPIAAFKLLWQQELNNIKTNINKISHFSSAELTKMLQEVMDALQVKNIIFDLFKKNNSFAVCSFSYYFSEHIGLIWYEQPNLGSFCSLMKASEKLCNSGKYEKLILIRSQRLGNSKNKGYQLFQEIFQNSDNSHIVPDLESVTLLATYHSLYSFATNKNLTVGYETPDVSRLQELTCQSGVLTECTLLQKLKILNTDQLQGNYSQLELESDQDELEQYNKAKIEDFILNLVQTQLFIGREVLTDKALVEFGDQANLEVINYAMQSLLYKQQIQIVNPKGTPDEQSICLPV
jgi:Cdc6-like AAA superfamily ATPase